MEPRAAPNLVVVFSRALYAPPLTRSAVTTSPNTYRWPSSSKLTVRRVMGASWPACTRRGSISWATARPFTSAARTTATAPPVVYRTLASKSLPEMATDRNGPIFSCGCWWPLFDGVCICDTSRHATVGPAVPTRPHKLQAKFVPRQCFQR